MNELVLTLVASAAASLPAVIGLLNGFKPFVTDKRLYFPLALVLGIALNIVLAYVSGARLDIGALTGLFAGMGAAGVYDLAQPKLSAEYKEAKAELENLRASNARLIQFPVTDPWEPSA